MTTDARVTFQATGIPTVVVLQDATAAQITDGYGNWTLVPRERRISLTQWQGKDPIRMSIPVLFDGWSSRTSQELPISHLSRMALPPVGGGEPPTVMVKGPAVPKPGPTVWVIDSLAWGTNVNYDTTKGGSPVRLRQDCVVGLLQYVADDRVAFASLAPASLSGKSKTGWPKTYFVQLGDTLQVVAAKYYNDSTKWHQIADANNIRDPRNLVGVTTLKIPAP